jgi:two-component system phosphate regulon sensor histidine kinase PhoR
MGAAGHVERSLARSQESRRELEALLDSMQDAVIAVDAAGRIQWTNQRMQRLIPGHSISGTVRVGHALVQTIRDPEVLACVGSALESRTVCDRKTTSLLPGRTFEVIASPMPGGGAVAVLHDVTRIEQVERTQRDFVANVSHELRTPLTSITGYVETLLDHEKTLSPTAHEFLSTILKNATRMNRLTEDLLVMARIESSEQELHPAPIPADLLVRDAVQAMKGLVQDTEAELEIGDVTSRQVYADQDAVMQVLGNLIENAIKYGRTKGSSFSRVVVSAVEVSEPYEVVEFRVRDFGQGIASEHLTRIFERFYRVDKARSRESGGTGLGLAIAQHMVQTQGGTIRAESELNRGSTFIFTLPVAQYPVIT